MAISSITRNDLKSLAEAASSCCVSIYLTAPRAGEETRESPYRLKLLLQEARARFLEKGVDKRQAARLLQPFEALLDDYPFWQHQFGGVGLFVTDDFFRAHQTSYAVSDRVIIGERFHVKPLLPMWAGDGEFLLLTLSKNAVALYRASRFAFERVPLENVPQSEAEALRFDDPEKSLQVHPGQPGGRGEQTAIIHGHGAAREEAKERTLRFFHFVNRGLKPHLSDEQAPLLLAGVDYYLPLYRQANSYPHLVDAIVPGNPEEVREEELHRAAWKVMEPHFGQKRKQAFEAIEQGLANGRATDDLEQAVSSACQGRADTCFVALEEHCWGAYDASTAKIRILDRTDRLAVDLLDLAVTETLIKGGNVFPAAQSHELPGGGPIAVLNRF